MDDFMLRILASNARYNYWGNRAWNKYPGLEAHDDVCHHAVIFCRNYGGRYAVVLKAMLKVDAEVIRG